MSFISIGDLAQSFHLRRLTGELKSALERHGQEVITGRVHDPARALRGHYTPLAGVEHGRTRIAAFASAARETAIHAEAMQARLGQLMQDSADTARQLNAATVGAAPGIVNSIAATGRGAFEAAISALNGQVGDRALFAGTASGGPALAPASEILAALTAATDGIDTPEALAAAVSAWFDAPGGGFENLAYRGSGTEMASIAIGPDDRIALPGSAADPAIRSTLAGFALAALVDLGAMEEDPTARADTLRLAGEQLTEAQPGLTGLAARLGSAEARIDLVRTRNSAEAMALDFARQDLLDVDPYEAGLRLEETRGRLEALFQVTARLSQLRLSDYLR